MEPASAEHLLEAFQLFDRDGKGTLSSDLIGKLITEEGEPFTQVIQFSAIYTIESCVIMAHLIG